MNDVHRHLPALARERLDGVHRTHGALDHRQQQRPVGLAAREIVIEGVRDQRILSTVEHRLKRHLREHRDRGPQRLRQSREDQRRRRQGALEPVLVLGLPAAAADEEEHLPGRRIHVRRTHQDQLVLPRNLAPGLGGQDELGNLGGANTSRLHFAPRITRVGRSDVAGELTRGFGACARWRDREETGRERRAAARNVHERMLGAAKKGRRAQRRDSPHA